MSRSCIRVITNRVLASHWSRSVNRWPTPTHQPAATTGWFQGDERQLAHRCWPATHTLRLKRCHAGPGSGSDDQYGGAVLRDWLEADADVLVH